MESDQVPKSDLPPVPEDDDLNATVIITQNGEVFFNDSSVIREN